MMWAQRAVRVVLSVVRAGARLKVTLSGHQPELDREVA